MDINLAAMVGLVAVVLGASWKLWSHIRLIEVQLTNHLRHDLERIEDKIEKVHDLLLDHITGSSRDN